MASTVNLKASGLVTSPNQLSLPDGSLIEASNVIIKRDNVLEQRRGFATYGTEFGTSTDRAKQLMVYQNQILRHYSNVLQYENGVTNLGVPNFSSFSGNVSEQEAGIRIKNITANGNLYFTSSDGIKKISASSASQFTTDPGFVTNAGGIKALDLSGRLDIQLGSQTGFLPADSAVAYRVVWGIKDNNNNLILGSPSQRLVVYNPLSNLILLDFQNLLVQLDNINQPGSLINDGNYVSTLGLNINSSATQLYDNLLSLALKLDSNIVYADNDGSLSANPPFEIDTATITGTVANVTFINSTPGAKVSQYFHVGSKIYLNGSWSCSTGTLAGAQTITVVDDSTNSISFNTTATGTVTIASDSAIQSNIFTSITQPPAPSLPATHDDLVALQSYLQKIIIALQALPSQLLVANGTGTGVNLTISSAAIAAGTCTVTFSAGDPRDYLIAGDTVVLSGFQPTVGILDIQHTIASVTSTTITFATTATGSVSLSTPLIYKNLIISDSLLSTYITPINVTNTANVILTITVPEEITSDYFFQIYRSAIDQATDTTVLSTEIFPSDELQQVYEAFLTSSQLSNRSVTVEDITPDAFRGANLYTNGQTGEGILQANNYPPFAKDINFFKNTVFYANTRTRQNQSLNLLGVSNIIALYNAGTIPKLTIANDLSSNTYSFITGLQQTTSITTVASGSLASSGPASYFTLSSANNVTEYYVWFKLGTAVDPAVSGLTGIEVVLQTGDSAATVATKAGDAISAVMQDFFVSIDGSSTFIIENVDFGYTTDAAPGTSGFTINVTQAGQGERVERQQTQISFVADVAGSLAGTYFEINSAFDNNQYYVWYKVSGVGVDPAVAGKTGILVNISTNNAANIVALNTSNALIATGQFTTSQSGFLLTVTNKFFGLATNATAETSGFTVTTLQEGGLDVLLSTALSPSVAVDETARSLVHVINSNQNENVYAYYLSGAQDVPGKMFIEGRNIIPDPFYLITNDSSIGSSFNPDLTPNEDSFITSISTGDSATMLVTTSSPHGLVNQDTVVITGSDSSPSIDGYWQIVYISPTTFRIDATVNVAGTTGYFLNTKAAVTSQNELKPNRVYYSKLLEPESVPIVNNLDVGASDKAILRIFPLRDSLFVFKEDGLWRISGEVAPFTVSLFDLSCFLISPDSVAASNNVVYGWTTLGIVTITESGVSVPAVSRSIDTQILKLGSSNFPHFKTATWGIGYESDNSYLVATIQNPSDTEATIIYRYSNLTNSWTTYDKTNTCGVVRLSDDKLYLGAGDINFIEQERKTFTRLDYADREISTNLFSGLYFGNKIKLTDVSNISAGDVLQQTQYLSVYEYNSLLQKLDLDTVINDPTYFSSLKAVGGNDLRTKIVDLADKLNVDLGSSPSDFPALVGDLSGTISNISPTNPTIITSTAHGLVNNRIITITGTDSTPFLDGIYQVTVIDADTFSIPVSVTSPGTVGSWTTNVHDFRDITACYNGIISHLNGNPGVGFSNYQPSTNTVDQEAIITNVNIFTKEITLNLALDFIVGPMIVFEAINSTYTYAPNTMQDPLGLKHISEATIMFNNKAFTSAKLSFASDLKPQFYDVPFFGDGNGIFGYKSFGLGFFGGSSNSAPFRTYIPRDYQRCRYILVKFTHNTAREMYSIYGATITGEVGQSTRAYR